jgi:hypothetical protein
MSRVGIILAGIALVSILTGGVLMQSSTVAQQTEDLCGTEVKGDLELSSDLVCDSNGLHVTGFNLTIHLNGHTIRGPGTESNTTGILVDAGREVRIRGPGIVTGFGTGVVYTDASGGAMRDTYLLRNDIGILMDQSTDLQIKQDHVSENRIGVLNRASNNTEVEITILTGNKEAIRLEKSTSVDVDFNVIMDGGTGVYMDKDSIGNELFYMIMFRNTGPDAVLANLGEARDQNNYGNNECVQSTPMEICEGKAELDVIQNQTQGETGNSTG